MASFQDQNNAFKTRRARNNIWLGAILIGFVILVFSITVVKMTAGHNMEAFDHTIRPSLVQE